MKKKILSMALGMLFVTGITTPIYANETDVLPKNDREILSGSALKNDIMPMGNWRYRETKETETKLIKEYSMYVSASQADSNAKYGERLKNFAGAIIGAPAGPVGSLIMGSLLPEFLRIYKTPYDKKGTYYIKVYSVYQYARNVLTGRRSVRRKGYKVSVRHDGVTTTRTLWEK